MFDWIKNTLGGSASATRLLKRGNEQLERGELEKAAESYRAAVALHPGAEGFVNLGYALRELGRTDAARAPCSSRTGASWSRDATPSPRCSRWWRRRI